MQISCRPCFRAAAFLEAGKASNDANSFFCVFVPAELPPVTAKSSPPVCIAERASLNCRCRTRIGVRVRAETRSVRHGKIAEDPFIIVSESSPREPPPLCRITLRGCCHVQSIIAIANNSCDRMVSDFFFPQSGMFLEVSSEFPAADIFNRRNRESHLPIILRKRPPALSRPFFVLHVL